MEIGSNSCVDRGSVDDTVIGAGPRSTTWSTSATTSASGERCLLMAGVGIAGSTRIGDDVILAGHVGVTDHLVIGDRGSHRGQERRVRRHPGGRLVQRPPRAPAPPVPPRPGGAVSRWPRSSPTSSGWCRRKAAMGRRTLAGTAEVRGIGLHTGREVTARCVGGARRGRASYSGGWICPARPRFRPASPRSSPPSGAPRWAAARSRCRRSSTCWRPRRRSSSTISRSSSTGPSRRSATARSRRSSRRSSRPASRRRPASR